MDITDKEDKQSAAEIVKHIIYINQLKKTIPRGCGKCIPEKCTHDPLHNPRLFIPPGK